MSLQVDSNPWTDLGRKVVTPSYYAFVNGTFVNINSPGGVPSIPLGDTSAGIKQSKFVPRKGELNLGRTDPLPTTKTPSEFNCALGVGVLIGFQKALSDAQIELDKQNQTQSASIAEEDLRTCLAGLIRAQTRASVTFEIVVTGKTMKGKSKKRILIHGHSRR